MKRLISLGFGIVLLAFSWSAAQSFNDTLRAAKLEDFMAIVGELRAALDRNQFDLASLSFELALEEPEVIVDYVATRIAFEPYEGVLRGAEGTLISSAGNSLDQVLLLQDLLIDWGADTRILRTSLSEAQAISLLQEMQRPRLQADIADEASVERLLLALAELAGLDEQQALSVVTETLTSDVRLQQEDYAQALAHQSAVIAQLEQAGITLGGDLEATLVQAAQDYYWLEYDVGEGWQAAHPAFAEGPPSELSAEEYYVEELPASLYHQLKLELFVETLQDDELSRTAIIDPWIVPAYSLMGQTISLTHTADSLYTADSQDDILSRLPEAKYFIPLLNGTPRAGDMAFNLAGELSAASEAFSQGEIADLGQATGGAFGALTGGNDQEEAASELVQVWLELSLMHPNGSETRYQRSILDRADPTARAEGRVEIVQDPLSASYALISQHHIAVQPGSFARGLIQDRLLERLQGSQAMFEFLLFDDSTLDFEAALRSLEAEWLGHYLLFDGFDAVAGTFRPEPSVVIYKQAVSAEDSFQLSIDIVHNARRSLVDDNDLAVTRNILLGSWETTYEATFLKSIGNTMSASEILAGTPTITVSTAEALDALTVPAATLPHLKRDLDAGYVLLVPELMPDEPLAAWWRVDPATGETLGVTRDGRGQSMIEMLETTAEYYDYAFTAMFAINAFDECNQNSSNAVEQACCYIKAYVDTVVGMSLGNLIGSGMGGLAFTLATGVLQTDFGGQAVSDAVCSQLP